MVGYNIKFDKRALGISIDSEAYCVYDTSANSNTRLNYLVPSEKTNLIIQSWQI